MDLEEIILFQRYGIVGYSQDPVESPETGQNESQNDETINPSI